MKKSKIIMKEETIIFIALKDLLPNPYQPATRFHVDPETAKKFALSIQVHGLIQTPVVRKAKEDGQYEIGDGWLRRAGFAYLLQEFNLQEYAKMPCVVRELTDQQMADMVLEANTIRKDLNPIELARLYKRYLDDFKIPQVELAKRHNCTQGEIANTIRLLELPADIQEKIISQEISETHGRQLLRLNSSPALQKQLVKSTIEYNYSVNELSNNIASKIYENSKNVDPDEYPKPVFDVAECKDCPKCEKLGSPYSSKKKTARCFDVACYEKKQAKAEREQQAKLAAEIKAAKDAARGQSGKAKGKGKGDGEPAVLDCTKLTGRDYQELDGWRKIDNPAQCKTCSNRAMGSFYNGRTSAVCIDLKCFREKEKALEVKQAAKAREEEHKITERIKAACEQKSLDGTVLKVVSEFFLAHSRKDTREKVSRLFGLKDPNACFEVENESQLIQRIAAMVVMKEHLEGEKGLFFKMLAELEGNSAELEKQIEDFRNKFCKSCQYEKEDGRPGGCDLIMRVFPDGKCYRYYKRKKESGAPSAESSKSEDETLRDSLPCADCANSPTCERTFFYAKDEGGYACDNKVKQEANV
jgi:ParB/RepB/Spo0J family partition protein